MNHKYFFLHILILSGLLAALGCTGDRGSVVPTTPNQSTQNAPQITPGEAGLSGHQLIDYADIEIDPVSMTAEIFPNHSVQEHFNMVPWLEHSYCLDCLTVVKLVQAPGGNYLLDLRLKNPFASKYLTLFDVRGIMLFNGSKIFPVSGLVTSSADLGNTALVNPDGYTSLYNAFSANGGDDGDNEAIDNYHVYVKGKLANLSVPSSTLNGFQRFTSAGSSNTRNALLTGDSATRTFEITNIGDKLNFGYAVDANWAKPNKIPVVDPMADFPPAANATEPWKIAITEQPVGTGLTDKGGKTDLLIDLYTIYGKQFTVTAEIPELFSGSISTSSIISSGAGYIRYKLTIENKRLAKTGGYLALISAKNAQNSPYEADLTGYQLRLLKVVTSGSNQPPVALAKASPNPQTVNLAVNFSDNGSYDPDGTISKYEWDWDNNGTFDATGATASHTWTTAGTYNVQFRVTDNSGATATLASPLAIVINPANQLPVALAKASPNPQTVNLAVNFSDNGSYDPDGTISKYEWDWDNNGTFDATGATASHTWTTAGTYNVQFRVTDNSGATATLASPLAIVINPANQLPTAIAKASPNPQTVNLPIAFSDNGSFDPDGTIAKYEWDWDNNGTWDATGATANHTWATAGTYNVQFRVTDNSGGTDTLNSPLQIVINPVNQLPTAIAKATPNPQTVNLPIAFADNGSFDPDGTIAKYEWDWDNNGTWDATGATANHTWATAGTYNVQFRVTDNSGGTDTLNSPLQIVINPPSITWNNTIGSMLNSSCSCHISSAPKSIHLDSYVDTMASPGAVAPGNPNSSAIYVQAKSGGMKYLNATQLQQLYDWIMAGAPEN